MKSIGVVLLGLVLALSVVGGIAPAHSEDKATKPQSTVDKNEIRALQPYLKNIEKRIKRNWFPPKGAEGRKLKVVFKVTEDGNIDHPRIQVSSQDSRADNAAIIAVKTAAPFGPLPAEASKDMEIEFTFDYAAFDGCGKAVIRRY